MMRRFLVRWVLFPALGWAAPATNDSVCWGAKWKPLLLCPRRAAKTVKEAVDVSAAALIKRLEAVEARLWPLCSLTTSLPRGQRLFLDAALGLEQLKEEVQEAKGQLLSTEPSLWRRAVLRRKVAAAEKSAERVLGQDPGPLLKRASRFAETFQDRDILLIGEAHNEPVSKKIRTVLRSLSRTDKNFELFEETGPINKWLFPAHLPRNISDQDPYLESDSMRLMSEHNMLQYVYNSVPKAGRDKVFTMVTTFVLLLSRSSSWVRNPDKRKLLRTSLQAAEQGEWLLDFLERFKHRWSTQPGSFWQPLHDIESRKKQFAPVIQEVQRELIELASNQLRRSGRAGHLQGNAENPDALVETLLTLVQGWSEAIVNENFTRHVREKLQHIFGEHLLPEEQEEFDFVTRGPASGDCPHRVDDRSALINIRDLAWLYRAEKRLRKRASQTGTANVNAPKKPIVFIMGDCHVTHFQKRLEQLFALRDEDDTARPGSSRIRVARLHAPKMTLDQFFESDVAREHRLFNFLDGTITLRDSQLKQKLAELAWSKLQESSGSACKFDVRGRLYRIVQSDLAPKISEGYLWGVDADAVATVCGTLGEWRGQVQARQASTPEDELEDELGGVKDLRRRLQRLSIREDA